MLKHVVFSAFNLAIVLQTVAADHVSTPPLALRTRNAAGLPEIEVWKAVRRAFSGLSLDKRDTSNTKSVTLDRSWQDVTLFTFSGETERENKHNGTTTLSTDIEILCTECYIKGVATTRLNYNSDFNFTKAFDDVKKEFKEEFDNFTTYTEDYVQDNLKGFAELDFPPFEYDFNIDIDEVPGFDLEFQFDGFELYMAIDTVLGAGATYTLPLYAYGIDFDKGVEIAVIFSIDLILSVETQITISSGFHLKLDDGFKFNIGLFSKKMKDVNLNDGQFEFLPVTVEADGVVFKAILQVGARAAFELDLEQYLGNVITKTAANLTDVSVGFETAVYANIAELITNITRPDKEMDDPKCLFRVAESYGLAVGAIAGLHAEFAGHAWGPEIEAETTLFETTFATTCVTNPWTPKTSAATAPVALDARDDGESSGVTEITSTATLVLVKCESTGLINCPVSLQRTSKTEIKTVVTTVVAEDAAETQPSGLGQAIVTKTISFGDDAHNLRATSGAPKPYNSSTDHEKWIDDKTNGVPNRVILGVSLGIGIPVLLGVIIASLCLLRRRKSPVQEHPPITVDYSQPPSPEYKSPVRPVVQQRESAQTVY